MIGYKVFINRTGDLDWSGPHYSCVASWKIKKGEILENPSGVDPDTEDNCSFGVNFYNNKEDAMTVAKSYRFRTHKTVVYKIKTLKDSVVVIPEHDFDDLKKCRADKIQLLERVCLYVGGKRK